MTLKIVNLKLQEMKNMINMRFGPDTWQTIIDTRAKRIAEQKEAEKQARIQKLKEEAEFWENVKSALIMGGVAIFMVVAFSFVILRATGE